MFTYRPKIMYNISEEINLLCSFVLCSLFMLPVSSCRRRKAILMRVLVITDLKCRNNVYRKTAYRLF